MALGGPQVGGWQQALGEGLMGGLTGAEKQLDMRNQMLMREQENQLAMQRYAQEMGLQHQFQQQNMEDERQRNRDAGDTLTQMAEDEVDPTAKAMYGRIGRFSSSTGMPVDSAVRMEDNMNRMRTEYRLKTLEQYVVDNLSTGNIKNAQQGFGLLKDLKIRTTGLANSTTSWVIQNAESLYPNDINKQREFIKNGTDYFNSKNTGDITKMTPQEIRLQIDMSTNEMVDSTLTDEQHLNTKKYRDALLSELDRRRQALTATAGGQGQPGVAPQAPAQPQLPAGASWVTGKVGPHSKPVYRGADKILYEVP